MKFNNYLKEEYCSTYSIFQILVNPTSIEINKFKNNSVRYMADQRSKNLYIWDSDALHSDVINHLISKGEIRSVPREVYKNENLLTGVADSYRGKLYHNTSDQIESDIQRRQRFGGQDYLLGMINHNWLWLKSYFINLKFIEEYKKELE